MKTKSLPIIGALFLVFAMAVQSFVSYHRETENMQSYIESRMELAEKKFLFEVYDMYEATDEIIHFFPQYNPRNLAPLLSAVLGRFPNLYSCYVAFTPQSSPLPGRQFAPGALRREGEDSIVITDYADRVDYLSRDWYSGALLADDEGYWSLPYNDADHQYPVFTHSRILRNTHGQIIAVVGADYTLAWTHRLLDEFKPYPDALCQLYSTEGELVVQCGEAKAGTSMLTVERTLSPTSMRLLISVPRSHLLHAVWRVSLLTLLVLLLGIVIALLLIRRIWRDQRNYLRIETNHQLIERELHIASSIQQGILRHDPPDDHRLQLSATLIPMHEVGGDLYDYQLHGDDLYFIVGDVSGKGVPAAIFMSAAVILFRSAVRRLASPKEIVSEMNALLSANNPSLTFVTAFVGRLHIPSGQFLYCNAAHNPPLLINEKEEMRNGEYLPVKPNLPLGYNPSFPYVEQGLFLEHDQLLLLYTDGVTEARNPARQLFGTQRLLQAGTDALAAMQAFTAGAPQADDITILTLRRNEPSQPFALSIASRLEQWPLLRDALRRYCLCLGVEPPQLKKIELALEEAVVNIISYAYPPGQPGPIQMTLHHSTQNSKLSITLSDSGTPFNPLEVEGLDKLGTGDRRIGGLGLLLLRQITQNENQNSKLKNSLSYSRTPEGQNQLTMEITINQGTGNIG